MSRTGWLVRARATTVAVAALVLLACGRGERGAASAIRIPLINDPILNPVLAPDIGSVMINKVIFPGLVRPDESLRPTPDLALSWTVSDDGRTWEFRLRPGVRWHDGAPFSAEDVKFTFDQILDVNSGSRLRSDFAAVHRVEVVDSLTVRFHLRAPFAPFLALLGYNAGILPAHVFEQRRLLDATEFNRSRPIGTGPFRVVESLPGSAIVLERNPDYYGPTPGVERLIFRIVPDVNAQVAQLRAGELDLVVIEPANLPGVEGVPGIEVRQHAVVQHFYVGFHQQREPFRSALVRRALGYAVNRQAIVDGVLKGYADPPRGTIPVALGDYYDTTVAPVPYAPDSARALLAQAGWHAGEDGVLRDREGQPFRFTLLVDKGNPTREQAALAVQHDLRRIGVAVDIETMEFATLVRDRVLPGTFEAVLIWWTTPPDPDQFAFYATGQDNNHVRYSNRAADSLLALGRATLDPDRRRAVYAALQRLQREDPPVLVLYYPREIVALSSRLRGLERLGIRDALRHSEALSLAPR